MTPAALLPSPPPQPGATTGRFLSPYGIAAALGMLLNGVEPGGESYRQLQAAVYGGGAALDALNAQLRQLSQALVKGGQGPAEDGLTVADANSAWLAPRYTLQKAYADALAAVFGAAAQPLTGATAVNEWVAKATRGKISEIVDDGAVAQVGRGGTGGGSRGGRGSRGSREHGAGASQHRLGIPGAAPGNLPARACLLSSARILSYLMPGRRCVGECNLHERPVASPVQGVSAERASTACFAPCLAQHHCHACRWPLPLAQP